MPLFKCEKCGCVENTALCFYWPSKAHKKPTLCSECDPDIGKWHGRFEKRSAEGMRVNGRGFLEEPNRHYSER